MNPFSKLFRRKPPTPKQGRAILDTAIRQTLDNGLLGSVIGEVRNDAEGEAFFSVRGDIGEGLSRALELLLENPQTRAAAQYAIITALKKSGGAQVVQMVGDPDCECPMCTARRMKEERQPTTTTH